MVHLDDGLIEYQMYSSLHAENQLGWRESIHFYYEGITARRTKGYWLLGHFGFASGRWVMQKSKGRKKAVIINVKIQWRSVLKWSFWSNADEAATNTKKYIHFSPSGPISIPQSFGSPYYDEEKKISTDGKRENKKSFRGPLGALLV